MAKSSLRSIGRDKLTVRDKVGAVYLQEHDDRTAVLIASSMIEHGLENHIKSRFRRLKRQEAKDLFEGTSPLATFSAKIRMAHALGIVGPKTKHDLTTINEIRNAFAHAAKNLTFKNKRIRDRVNGMHIVQSHAEYKHQEGRDKFLKATNVFILLLVLMSMQGNLRPNLRWTNATDLTN